MRTEKWETGGKVGNEEDIGKERSESRSGRGGIVKRKEREEKRRERSESK